MPPAAAPRRSGRRASSLSHVFKGQRDKGEGLSVGKMRQRTLAAVVLGLALLGAGLAQAAETTRAEYVAAVEPICQANTKANARILHGIKSEVRRGRLKPAARQLARAAAALQKTLLELKAVPQPPADQAQLAKWLGYVKIEVGLLQRISRKLKAGDKVGTETAQVRLEHNANLANNAVLAFEFRYCHFNISKFM